MQTHTIQVSGIPDDVLRLLDRKAVKTGADRDKVIRDIIEKGLAGDADREPDPSFDESLASIRQGFSDSGLSEAEAERLLAEQLRMVRRERRIANESNAGS